MEFRVSNWLKGDLEVRTVAHTYNLSYLGGEDWEDGSLRLV
jgi:hypothetical protein